MRTLFLMALYALVSLLTAQGLYFLGGGEEECFHNLAVEDNPLTCAPGLIFFIEVLFGLVGAVLLVPMWVWLRGARWLPAPARFSLVLTTIIPLLLGLACFARYSPYVGARRAAWDAFDLAGPMLVALAAVVLASWRMNLHQQSTQGNINR